MIFNMPIKYSILGVILLELEAFELHVHFKWHFLSNLSCLSSIKGNSKWAYSYQFCYTKSLCFQSMPPSIRIR